LPGILDGGGGCFGKEVERLIGVRSGNAREKGQEQEGDRVSQTEQIEGYLNRGAVYRSTGNRSSYTSTRKSTFFSDLFFYFSSFPPQL
jgi:hypothetical protein